MRRLIACALLLVGLAACAEGPALAEPTPNLRQQTATALAILAANPTPTRVPTPTPTPFIPPTASPTLDLAPITVTPLPRTPSPEELAATAEAEQATATALAEQPTATPEPTAEPRPEPPAAAAGEIFFVRQGALWRYVVASEDTEQIMASATWFRASPDGSRLAVVDAGSLILVNSDGSKPQKLLDAVIETPVWSPDGTALAVVTGPTAPDELLRTCTPKSQVVVIELDDLAQRTLGEGCQPAWDHKSRRLVFVTPQFGDDSRGFNTLVLINRLGQNGWTPVSAPVLNGNFPDPRRLLYAPFWSEDDAQVYAFAYVGYRALSDISTFERIDPINGGTWPIGVVFDVLPRSVRAHANGDWAAYTIASPKGTLEVATLPTQGITDTIDLVGTPIQVTTQPTQRLEFASAPVWSPERDLLAVVHCKSGSFGCRPGDRGAIWLLDPRSGLTTPLLDDVDFGAPLEWGP